MKTQILNLLFVLLLISIINSCSSKPENLIVGRWQMTEVQTNDVKAQNPEVKAFYKELANNSWSEFNDNLTCLVTTNGLTQKGRWTILGDGKQLHIIPESDSKIILNIEEITEDQLILSSVTDGIESKQIFSKVK